MKDLKLGLGAGLCAIGALGIILGPMLGLAELGRPWSFLVGFVFGLMAGTGAVLSLAGLSRRRRPPANK
jgi:F0F1-type ATP synthase assembly protein I